MNSSSDAVTSALIGLDDVQLRALVGSVTQLRDYLAGSEDVPQTPIDRVLQAMYADLVERAVDQRVSRETTEVDSHEIVKPNPITVLHVELPDAADSVIAVVEHDRRAKDWPAFEQDLAAEHVDDSAPTLD